MFLKCHTASRAALAGLAALAWPQLPPNVSELFRTCETLAPLKLGAKGQAGQRAAASRPMSWPARPQREKYHYPGRCVAEPAREIIIAANANRAGRGEVERAESDRTDRDCAAAVAARRQRGRDIVLSRCATPPDSAAPAASHQPTKIRTVTMSYPDRGRDAHAAIGARPGAGPGSTGAPTPQCDVDAPVVGPRRLAPTRQRWLRRSRRRERAHDAA